MQKTELRDAEGLGLLYTPDKEHCAELHINSGGETERFPLSVEQVEELRAGADMMQLALQHEMNVYASGIAREEH